MDFFYSQIVDEDGELCDEGELMVSKKNGSWKFQAICFTFGINEGEER
jgi:hypothetical protein